jgi:hypothetical protein
MGAAWMPCALSLLLFLGAGGPALGLVRLVCPWSCWGTVAVLALGAAAGVFSAAAMLAVQPAGVWIPPAALLGLCILVGLPGVRLLCSLAALMQNLLEAPFLQVSCLLVGGPALVLWSVSEPAGDLPFERSASPDLIYEHRLEPISPSPLVTDRGRPVLVARTLGRPPSAAFRKAGEEMLLDQARLHGHVIALPGIARDCDCHGWVFAGGLYWVCGEAVEEILADNGYRPVSGPRPGDVVIYRNPDRDILHSGVVRGTTPSGLVLVESKWGLGGVFLHPVDRHPYGGSAHTYYRSPRAGHRLHEAPGVARVAAALVRRPPAPARPR